MEMDLNLKASQIDYVAQSLKLKVWNLKFNFNHVAYMFNITSSLCLFIDKVM